MWKVYSKKINRGWRYKVQSDGKTLSFDAVLILWKNDVDFRDFFIGLFADFPFSAYRWETPAVTESTISRDFEFVIIRDDSLIKKPNPSSFSSYFDSKSIVTFLNLGHDARLVVPTPNKGRDYSHLGAFMANAPIDQKHDLWQQVGRSMLSRISEAPVWLNTAGTGVPWLHVRLDDRPKYYLHQPYQNI